MHIIGSLGLGGAQVSVKYLVENANAKEVETFVYPLRSKHIDIPINGKVIKLPYFNYDPRKFLAILKLCKKHQIDIIHAHLHKPIIASLLATFFCKAKVVIHERGPIFGKGLQFSIYRFLLRLLHHRAAVIIANSHATAKRLAKKAKINPKQIRVVYNATDFSKFKPQRPSRNHIRKLLQAAPNDTVLGFVGRLSNMKGGDLLIEAMSLLLKKSARYLLVLVGDGPKRQSLETLTQNLDIAERVRFLGFRENIAEIMNAFDIAVIPSRYEPFGIVALEFMRTKIPLVCSGTDGLAELVENEVTALVPVENTPQQICRSVERLADDGALRKLLTDNAYLYSERFSVQNHVKTIEQIYSEILNSDKD